MMERLKRDNMGRSQSLRPYQIISLLFITMCSFPSLVLTAETATSKGVCPTKYIRNHPDDLLQLTGCRVIEGNLQISLIDSGIPEQYKNLTFPDLREITGYFLLFSATGLQSLRNLFPNLAVIRGQDFIYDYAFLINEMPDMQEIGLPSLTNVMGRGVLINTNSKLCYVDTVDWGLITNGSQNDIRKNMPSDQCPNKCPDSCPTRSEVDSKLLCWTNEDCQKVRKKTCDCESGLCYGENLCCSTQCLGGCTGPTPADCHVCKHFENDMEDGSGIICMGHCKSGTYEYSSRRCVRKEDCYKISNIDPKFKVNRTGKILSDQDKCVLECPKGYKLGKQNGSDICERCEGQCKKICPGAFVYSSETTKMLKGCTRINGSLKIQIRAYSANLMNDLRNNLDMIEEIDDTLIITNSHFVTSLEFLKSLKYIHGNKTQNGFALEVKSNDNIRDLFGNQTVIISNRFARVSFHYNPKLCANKIWDFVDKSTIIRPSDNKIDIGTTNGDKVPCNEATIALYEVLKKKSSVVIKWENFRRNLSETAHLLNYEIYYKISPEQNASIYQDRDACGNDDWTVLDAEKMNFVGRREDEPPFEDNKIVPNLKAYTQYAFYVKTVVIPIPESNSTGAISPICYITTLPDVPSPPREVKFTPSSSTSIKIEWQPPENPNGVIEKYEIYVKDEEFSIDFQNQRDYCKGRPEVKVEEKGKPLPTLPTLTNNGGDCCSCSKKPDVVTDVKNVLEQTDISDHIISAVFISHSPASPSAGQSDGKRRRRRQVIESDSIGNETDNSSENAIVFQGQDFPIEIPSVITPGMKLNVTVNASDAKPGGDYEITIPNLAHYGRYTIGIIACRDRKVRNQTNGCREKNSTVQDVTNDLIVCSDMTKETINTLPSPTADLINASTIVINVTLNKLMLSWEEPKHPNGIVMSYRINVTRVDSTGSSDAYIPYGCISSLKFNENGRKYKFESPLSPGNYSVRIQTLSLSPTESNYTAAQYFMVYKVEEGITTGQILAILLPIMIVLMMGVGVAIYVVRTKRELKKIISANPEYLQNVNIPEAWEVGPNNIKILEENGKPVELGKGSFGMVYKGILYNLKGQSIPCAIKTVGENSTSDDRYRFLTEASLMTQMDCHHVVRLLGVVSLSKPTYVIMELMEKGDLKKYLLSRRPEEKGDPPTLRQILRMAAGIADGMAYLDDHKYVHRDLAARNCMVAHDLTVKVGDFGMTKDVMDTEYYRKETRGKLPVRWMAPESIRSGVFTIQSDVWSYGVVLWEMATLAAQPYQGLNNEQVLRYVKDGGIMERPENCPEVLFNMMLRCWQPQPMARPTFAEILDWLLPELEANFAQVSFYHSPAGIKYRASLQARPVHQSQDDIPSSRTPLRATFEDDCLTESDENDEDAGSDGELHSKRKNGVVTSRANAISASLDSATNLPTAFPRQPLHNNHSTAASAAAATNNNNHSVPGDFFIDMNGAGRRNSPPSGSPSSRNNLSSSQQHRWTPPSESANVNVMTNRNPNPNSNESSKGISIVFSPSGDKLSNGNGPPTGYNPTRLNGFVQPKPPQSADAKSRTTQF